MIIYFILCKERNCHENNMYLNYGNNNQFQYVFKKSDMDSIFAGIVQTVINIIYNLVTYYYSDLK